MGRGRVGTPGGDERADGVDEDGAVEDEMHLAAPVPPRVNDLAHGEDGRAKVRGEHSQAVVVEALRRCGVGGWGCVVKRDEAGMQEGAGATMGSGIRGR